MERKQFLRSLGAGAAFAIVFPCVGACSSDDTAEVSELEGVDFSIDLEAPEASGLEVNGGFIVKNQVVVAKNLEGVFVAATQVCSHQQYKTVTFVSEDGGIFYCDVHGSRFSQEGAPLNTISSSVPKPIKIYNTTLNGTILRVHE